jgi:hypothetical protein
LQRVREGQDETASSFKVIEELTSFAHSKQLTHDILHLWILGIVIRPLYQDVRALKTSTTLLSSVVSLPREFHIQVRVKLTVFPPSPPRNPTVSLIKRKKRPREELLRRFFQRAPLAKEKQQQWLPKERMLMRQ